MTSELGSCGSLHVLVFIVPIAPMLQLVAVQSSKPVLVLPWTLGWPRMLQSLVSTFEKTELERLTTRSLLPDLRRSVCGSRECRLRSL